MDDKNRNTPITTDKSSAKADAPPRPTYAPIAMAMGIAMSAWGLLSLTLNINALLFMSLFGVGLMTWALKCWIREIVLQWESSR